MEEDEPFTLLETPRRFQELFSLEDVGTGALHDETAVRSSSGGSSTSDSHTEEETEGAEKRRRAAWDDSGVSTSDSEWGTSEPEEHREEHADGESPPARRDGRRSRVAEPRRPPAHDYTWDTEGEISSRTGALLQQGDRTSPPGAARPSTAPCDVCRICFGEGAASSPLAAMGCACKGDLARVHAACLRTWFEHSRRKHCEICLEPLAQLQPLKTPPRRAPGDGDAQQQRRPAEAAETRRLPARYLTLVVSCSGCCVASLVLVFGGVAFMLTSRLLAPETTNRSFSARLLLPLWFFVGMLLFYLAIKRVLARYYDLLLEETLERQHDHHVHAVARARDQLAELDGDGDMELGEWEAEQETDGGAEVLLFTPQR